MTIQRLIEAVRSRDLKEIAAILSVRPELVNTVEAWNYEYTPLHYAVVDRASDVVRTLMEFGADQSTRRRHRALLRSPPSGGTTISPPSFSKPSNSETITSLRIIRRQRLCPRWRL